MPEPKKVKLKGDDIADILVRGFAEYDPLAYDEARWEKDKAVKPLEGKALAMPKLDAKGCCEEEKK